jgi:hypothetical protein
MDLDNFDHAIVLIPGSSALNAAIEWGCQQYLSVAGWGTPSQLRVSFFISHKSGGWIVVT